jgi:hypothetical protein
MKNLMIAAFALCFLESGCAAPAVVPTWALTGLDTRIREGGGELVLDSGRNWRILSSAIKAEVRLESQGLPPPWSTGSWAEFWRTTIAKMSATQEHPERYFNLIVQLRREHDLPDLPKDVLGS